MSIRAFQFVAGLWIASLSLFSFPVRADEVSDLDLLSRATDDSKTGLALARDQIGSGDLSGAMATLERSIIPKPMRRNCCMPAFCAVWMTSLAQRVSLPPCTSAILVIAIGKMPMPHVLMRGPPSARLRHQKSIKSVPFRMTR
jgi:hypothetical protein